MSFHTFQAGRIAKMIFVVAAIVVVAPAHSHADLTINMNYGGFSTGAPATVENILLNDAWSAATPDSTRINNSIGVMDEAVGYIEAAFAGVTNVNLAYTVNVGWANLGAGTLAQGGATVSGGALSGNFLNWNDGGSATYFSDTTPGENSEYDFAPRDSRSKTISGKDVNVEDIYYTGFNTDSNVSAGNNHDMLSIAIHELLHATGILNGFSDFNNLDVGNDGDLDLMALGSTYEVTYTDDHVTETLVWDGPGGPTLVSPYYPTVMGPVLTQGTRQLLTDVDVLLFSNVHGFNFSQVNQPFNTIGIPEPASGLLLAVGSMLWVGRRRRNVA